MSEIRQNLLTGEWVIIAPERAKRPVNLARSADKPVIPQSSPTCPFCPGNEHMTTDERFRISDKENNWLVRSVVNRFSVLSVAESTDHEVTANMIPWKDANIGKQLPIPGIGLHEVIIEHPRHDLTPAQYTLSQIENLIGAYMHRFVEFAADPRIKHVVVFKNHGEEAGASQQHPHSQIVGLPIIPGQVFERIGRALRFHRDTGACLGCRIIEEECHENSRVIDENEAFIAFIPFAALSPFHLWIFPKKHNACFSQTLPEERHLLAGILHRVLCRIFIALDNPAYNLVVRSLIPSEGKSPFVHWYISIVPRVGKLAGFELGTGMFVNSSSPEVSADRLRQVDMNL
ncbi:MAG: galactose-1-phosphate uridylyltransferase [Candidatus Riflebacteria bacterium]|nr:galactose-1-phosphate uridylyltransferase [Candidatus Riflebacteria bacterium]